MLGLSTLIFLCLWLRRGPQLYFRFVAGQYPCRSSCENFAQHSVMKRHHKTLRNEEVAGRSPALAAEDLLDDSALLESEAAGCGWSGIDIAASRLTAMSMLELLPCSSKSLRRAAEASKVISHELT